MPRSLFVVGIVSVIGAAATVLVTSRSAGLNHLPAGALAEPRFAYTAPIGRAAQAAAPAHALA